jgi:hypothetical protein
VSERAHDQLGRCWRLPLARQTRGDTETGELDLSGAAVDKNIRRLDVLMDEATPVDLREGRSDRDGEPQKVLHLHGHAEQSVQRLAACVLEHQHHPAAFADKLERSHRPRPVQLVLQAIFARQAVEGGRGGMLRDGHHDQDGDLITVGVALSPAEDAFAVLPQHLKAAISTSVEPRG